jgi:CRP-like cAMP-binding protein
MTPPPRTSLKRDALLSNSLFQSMRGPEIDDVIAHSSERRVPRGALIFSKGDIGSSMMAVLNGRVRVGTQSPDGKEVTLNVIGPGEVFGEIALLDGKPRSADALAIEETLLMVVERKNFIPLLMRHEGLVERLLVVLCERLRNTSLALEEVALANLPARLARVLCRLAEDYGRPSSDGGVRIEMKLSQRDLANLVASTRESVNKQLRVWRTEGSVSLDAGYLSLRRPDDLRALFQ